MKRLPPAKRNQLIGVILASVGLIGLVYFLLISPQNASNSKLATNTSKETLRLQQMETTIKEMEATSNKLEVVTQQLNHDEDDIASGDLYAWTYDTMRRFKAGYRVDIPTLGQPALGDCDLIGNFPYKQIRFSLAGTAYYHDLGKFIAGFENKFPHCRVLNLSIDPVDSDATGGERLNFRMDIVALVKPNT